MAQEPLTNHNKKNKDNIPVKAETRDNNIFLLQPP
jgi:hypothetical protein